MSQENTGAKPTDIAEGLPPPSGPTQPPAYCPKCNGQMGSADPRCPHCGYDFPLREPKRPLFAGFSLFADVVLILGAVIAGLGFVAALVAACLALAGGQPGSALPMLMLAILLLALVIVFMRVQRLEPPP